MKLNHRRFVVVVHKNHSSGDKQRPRPSEYPTTFAPHQPTNPPIFTSAPTRVLQGSFPPARQPTQAPTPQPSPQASIVPSQQTTTRRPSQGSVFPSQQHRSQRLDYLHNHLSLHLPRLHQLTNSLFVHRDHFL